MSKMSYYGRNFVVYESKNGVTVKRIIEIYKKETKKLRQDYRIKRDIVELQKLNRRKRYKYSFRQYTGHRGTSAQIQTSEGRKDKSFVSSAIWW